MSGSPGRSGNFEPAAGDGTHSELSGSAGDVVQARDVNGGIHFHPAGRSAGRVPRQLPGDLRGFVNRVVELRQLDDALTAKTEDPDVVAVVVIVGTAGVGKTSLAVRWAHRIRDRYPDGQLYVNLRGYDPGEPISPDRVLDQFLRALDVLAEDIPADLQAKASLYRSIVADRRILVVLDNAATVGQVRPLLPGSASCLVLVTSRARLPGLVVRDGALRVHVDILSEAEAVTLLRTVTAGHRLADEPPDLAELARLCARLPLALRIAAERAASRPRMPLSELIQHLRDESELWDALSSEDDDEADAVRTVFAWSYRALSPKAARLFRLLGLHPGPTFCIGAAAALLGRTTAEVGPVLDRLLGAHLLQQTGPDCYQFHDLLRAYAIDQAHHEESEDDQHAAVRRVLTWYLHTTHAAFGWAASGAYAPPIPLDPPGDGVEPQSFPSYDQAVRWYEAERDNLIAAARTAFTTGHDRIAWQIPAVAYRLSLSFDPVSAWLSTTQDALEAARRADDRRGEAVTLDGLGTRLRLSHRLHEAIEHYQDALAAYREVEDRHGELRTLNGLGWAYARDHQLAEAIDQFEAALPLARTLNHRSLVGVVLRSLGSAYFECGRLEKARTFLSEAAEAFRETGEPMEESSALRYLSAAERDLGMLAAARESAERALTIATDLGIPLREGIAVLELGKIELAEGSPGDALVSSQRAAALFRRLGHRSREAQALEVTGTAYLRLMRSADAIAFHRQAVSIHRDLGDRWLLAFALDHLAIALEALGKDDDARDAWHEVRTLLTERSEPRATEQLARIDQHLSSSGGHDE